MTRESLSADSPRRPAAAPSPVVRKLPADTTPLDVFRALVALPHAVFFDSAMRHATLGRYSFLAADPFVWLAFPADGGDALGHLASALANYKAETVAGLPPFQGGAAGLLGYELAHSLESFPRPQFDEFGVPALAMGLYDVVVAFDHFCDTAWIISQGFPEIEPHARHRRAAERCDQFWQLLQSPACGVCEKQADSEISLANGSPRYEVSHGVVSDFSPDGYLRAVERAVAYIHAGDAFQVNLSQRLMVKATDSAAQLYERLRGRNAATFAGYFDLGNFQIASASPERFMQVVNAQVETRPIKGTRRRTASPEADLFAGDELAQSEKDRAENIMIVDLLRNDLSKVCEPDSVRVTQLCGLETYAYVQHLVSVVNGRLREGQTAVDLVRASFPGGSITGAPKVRAMQIISELEPTARGAYCGSLGYIGFDGTMDSNLLIRTITAGGGWWQLPAGGGIVAASDPRREYEETWHKALGMLKAIR